MCVGVIYRLFPFLIDGEKATCGNKWLILIILQSNTKNLLKAYPHPSCESYPWRMSFFLSFFLSFKNLVTFWLHVKAQRKLGMKVTLQVLGYFDKNYHVTLRYLQDPVSEKNIENSGPRHRVTLKSLSLPTSSFVYQERLDVPLFLMS